MNNNPVDSPLLSLFKEWVYERSDPYAAARIPDDPYLHLDRVALVKACGDMPAEDLAPALLYAVFHGDEILTENLWRERGPFPADLVHLGPKQFELNGQPYILPQDRSNVFETVRNIDQLTSMFDLIDQAGITGLLDGAGALFLYGQQRAVTEIARAVGFEGDLPVLSDESLSDPELMMALSEKAHGRRLRESYDPILCWATPEMVETYGAFLDPFVPVHGAKVADEQMSFEAWQKRHEEAVLGGAEPPTCNSLTLTCKSTTNDALGQIVMQAFGSKKHKHGIFEKEGYLLCHTSCKFLAEFERSAVPDSMNYAAARSFTDRYVPFDLMTLNAHPKGNLNWPTDIGFHQSYGGKELAFMNLGEDIHQALGPVLSHNQWKFILKGDWLVGEDIVTAVKLFGLDNQGMIWRINRDTASDLKALGYRIVPNSEVFLQEKKGESIWERRGTGQTCVDITDIKKYCKRKDLNDFGLSWGKTMLDDAFALGIWPFKDAKPPLTGLIASLARKKNPLTDLSEAACIARFTIKDAPIEECVKHVSKASEWTLLAAIHGPEAMQPYLREMPLTSVGKVFSQELGL